MFDKIGELRHYWHVLALADELKKGRSLKRNLYQVPLLLWRDQAGAVHVLRDVCAHKKAPLEVGDFQQNHVVCPYHGWTYAHNGKLLAIPSSPHLVQKMKCSLDSYPVIEQDGFIWVYPDHTFLPESRPESLAAFSGRAWKHYDTSMVFETNEELLIENFMDATHTPLVHNGLIRSNQTPTIHTLFVHQTQEQVRVEFEPANEKVGLGLRWMLGRNLFIAHTDAFVLPNLVHVTYTINNIIRFHACIACTPLSERHTQAFIRLSFRFGSFNAPIQWLIPYLTKKVLQQDFAITQKQFANREIFHMIPDTLTDYDLIHTKVRALRKQKLQSIQTNKPATMQRITVTF